MSPTERTFFETVPSFREQHHKLLHRSSHQVSCPENPLLPTLLITFPEVETTHCLAEDLDHRSSMNSHFSALDIEDCTAVVQISSRSTHRQKMEQNYWYLTELAVMMVSQEKWMH